MFYPVNLPDNLTFEQLVDKYHNQKHIIDRLTNQNNTYQTEITGIKSVLNTYSEKYRQLIIKYKELQTALTMAETNSSKQFQKYVEAKEEIIRLSDQAISYPNVILYFEKCRPSTTTELQWCIIKALFMNAHCQKNHRDQSVQMKEIGFIIMNQSPKSYNTLIRILPFPHPDTIRHFFCNEIKNSQIQFLSIDKISNTIQTAFKDFDIDTTHKIKATLAVDAIAIDSIFIQELKTVNGRHFIKPINEQIAFTYEHLPTSKQDVFLEAS